MAAVIPREKEHGGGVSLAEDIVFEVLARVPAKALCRFRCVCKGWGALISDPAFVAAQRSRAGPHLVAVFCRAWPLNKVQVMDMEGNIIRAFEVQLRGGKDDGTNAVLQQATTIICALGLVLRPDTGYTAHAMIIDPAAGHACGADTDSTFVFSSFGRAALSGAFKVLFVTYLARNNSCLCLVATIRYGGTERPIWRQTSSPPFGIIDHILEKRATVNGIVYFMPYYACSTSGIAAFDLESEEWNMINGPAFERGNSNVTLTELKGSLGVIQIPHVHNGDHYCVIVWLLVDSSKIVWEKEYTIQVPKTWGLPKQLWDLDDGRILFQVSDLEINYQHSRHVLVLYDPSTNAFTMFRDIEIEFGDALLLYTGSLLC